MTEPLRFGSVAGYRCLVWRDAPATLSMAVFLKGDGVAGLAARLAALPQVEVFHAHSCFEVHCLGFRADIRPTGWPTLVAHLRIRRNSPRDPIAVGGLPSLDGLSMSWRRLFGQFGLPLGLNDEEIAAATAELGFQHGQHRQAISAGDGRHASGTVPPTGGPTSGGSRTGRT